jgi:hypothetical protein
MLHGRLEYGESSRSYLTMGLCLHAVQLVMGLAFSLSIPPVFAIRVLLGLFESIFGPALTSSEYRKVLPAVDLQLTKTSYGSVVS